MRIFLDTADVDAVRRAHATGLLDGVTTNPTKVLESGRKFQEVVAEICEITPGPVSAEPVGATVEELIEGAEAVSKIAQNVVVKIPMTAPGLTAVPVLEGEMDIRVNVTMAFSATQAWLAMKAGASYVSIVLSRLDAVANESDLLVSDAALIRDNYEFATDIIAGSIKTQNHVLACLRSGIDIVTIPESLFFQMFEHPLTDIALTQFDEDWSKVRK